MLRGNLRARNSVQNLLMEENELKSISISIISASGLSFWIFSFTSEAFFKSLAGITIFTPLLAKILAVSSPIPDVAPNKNHTH